MEIIKKGRKEEETPDVEILMKYLPQPPLSKLPYPNNADLLRIWDARSLVFDVEKFFKRFE